MGIKITVKEYRELDNFARYFVLIPDSKSGGYGDIRRAVFIFSQKVCVSVKSVSHMIQLQIIEIGTRKMHLDRENTGI